MSEIVNSEMSDEVIRMSEGAIERKCEGVIS